MRLSVRAHGTETDVAVRPAADTADDADRRAEIRRVLDLPAAPALHGPLQEGAVLTDEPDPVEDAEIVLVVESGPDCGRIVPVPGRRITIGRADDNTVVIADPAVSRHQLNAEYRQSGLLVSSVARTNPPLVDGRPAELPLSLSIGRLLTIGRTGIRVAAAGRASAERQDGASHPAPPSRTVLDVPESPDPPRPRSLSIAAIVIPIIVAGVLVAVTHSAIYLTFCAFGPMTAIASYISDKRTGKRRSRKDQREYRTALARFDESLARTLADEAAALEALYPSPAKIRPAGFSVRLGTADIPSGIELRGRHGGVPTLPNAPAGLELLPAERASPHGPEQPERPVNALRGQPTDVTIALSGADAVPLARSITAQLCAGNGPADLRVVLADPDDAEWAWTRWLPHRGPTAADAGTVLVVGNSLGGANYPALSGRIIRLAPHAVGTEPAVISRGDGTGRPGPGWTGRRPDGDILLDLISSVTAETWARRLAASGRTAAGPRGPGTPEDERVVDSPGTATSTEPVDTASHPHSPLATGTFLPDRLDLARLIPMTESALARRWARRAPTTSAVIGRTAAGPLSIDLARDGPHLMLAGTTGAGKSELLQTLIFSLAAVNDPRDLHFVLFDFKGGSGLRHCAGLPHTAGTVTDLDEHLAVRAFTSLQAELRRRERAFARAGVADFDDFRAAGDTSTARLVIVIDEFRVLAEERPELLAAIVRTVCVGRSLGVHLVLATQRPAGIVSADMQANINARISLRVRDAADSREVIEAPDAARVSAATPGRAFMRAGGDRLIEFQAAQTLVGPEGASSEPRDDRRVRVLSSTDPLWRHADRARPAAISDNAVPVDPDAFTRAAGSFRGAGSPWLPPLPAVVAGSDLPSMEVPPASVPLGLGDEPATASRSAIVWSPESDGNLMLIGTTRSGRSQTIATALATLTGRAGASLYVLDAANRHGPIDTARSVGARVTPAEPDRAARVIDRLQREMAERTFRPAGQPPIVLVIDGWEAWAPILEGYGPGTAMDGVTAISRSGPSAGVYVLVAGDRPLAMSRLGTTISNKILLRQSDRADLGLLGVPRSAIPSFMPPGRGLAFGSFAGRRVDALELQLVLGGGAPPDGPDENAPAGAPGGRRTGRRADCGHEPPFVVRRLPGAVDLSELDPPTATRIPLGLGGDDAATVSWHTDRHFLVAGPPGSGRSTALTVIAEQCRRAGVPVYRPQHVCPSEPDPTGGPPGGDDPRLALVDDLDTLTPECERDLADLVGDGRLSVAAAGSTDRLASAFTGLAAMVKAGRHGVLLSPCRPMDGEVFGVRIVGSAGPSPGRGLFFDAAGPIPVVLARPCRTDRSGLS
ncbi:hypothetical protein GCM10027344_08830 [Spelaeicoccus albus]